MSSRVRVGPRFSRLGVHDSDAEAGLVFVIYCADLRTVE